MKTNEEILEELKKELPRTCIDAYKDRGLCAHDCPQCNYIEGVAEIVKKLLHQKDKEKIEIIENIDKYLDGIPTNGEFFTREGSIKKWQKEQKKLLNN